MVRWPLVLPVLTLLASTNAWALEPAKHRQLAEKYCGQVGLPDAFCRRMGKQVYETDYKEWHDLSAHAQRELGQDRCTAADAAATRVDRLAREAVAKTRAGDYEAGAIALGRAIHTLQDECAHHGMTNEEHSYDSLTQTCTDNNISPDTQPAAIACADARTRDAFSLVATALADTRWTSVADICIDYTHNSDNNTDQDACALAALPTPFMACDFLALHTDWDGEDSTWNGDRVGPVLMTAFAGGLSGGAGPVPMCGDDPTAIDPGAPHPLVTDREAGCLLIDITCLGKTDDPGAPTASMDSGGCSAGAGSPGLLLAAAALLGRRRRRRQVSATTSQS